jgi:hypothetical protein
MMTPDAIGAIFFLAVAIVLGSSVLLISNAYKHEAVPAAWSVNMNLKEIVDRGHEFGLSEETIRQTLWDEGYRIGRSRWYLGPRWFVWLTGLINNRKKRLTHLKKE